MNGVLRRTIQSYPSLKKVSDFLPYLRKIKMMSISSIKGYHFMLNSVFKVNLPEISESLILRDMICSFELVRPLASSRPPLRNLYVILRDLRAFG